MGCPVSFWFLAADLANRPLESEIVIEDSQSKIVVGDNELAALTQTGEVRRAAEFPETGDTGLPGLCQRGAVNLERFRG